jgi:hypothetical protein
MIIFHLIIPNLYAFVANGFDWDNDNQLQASILGQANGIFLFGQLLESTVSALVTDEFFEPAIRHPAGFVTPMLRTAQAIEDEGGISMEEFLDGSKTIDTALESGAMLTGVPVQTLYREMTGVNQFMTAEDPQDIQEGTLKALGWSPWVIENRINDDE